MPPGVDPTPAPTDSPAGARPLRRLLRLLASPNNYGLAILLIVATYGVALGAAGPSLAPILLLAQTGTVLQVLHTSNAHRGVRLVAAAVFSLGLIAAVANVFVDASSVTAVTFSLAAALYLIAPFSILRHIGLRREVDSTTMLGALAAFLLLGMAFAFIYGCLGAVQAGPFFGDGGEGTLSRCLFFSFVTLTTTGYGDLVPQGNPGQTVAVLEVLLGQLFIVTAVAKVVEAWRPAGWR